VLVLGVGAALSDSAEPTIVWLEFPAPRPFPAADRSVLILLCDYLQRVLARARAYDEQRTVALALQRSILGPPNLPAGFAARYEPASDTLEVGGDWYDVIALPNGRIGVVVGDVVGRGLLPPRSWDSCAARGAHCCWKTTAPLRFSPHWTNSPSW
jgi:hypothetical protein